MSAHLHNEMESALAELRAQQARIRELHDRIENQCTTMRSKDRMITATVDNSNRLIELELSGSRYRSLAPAELAARIVETVRSAQDAAASTVKDVLTELIPGGFGPGLGALVNGDFDLDRMFDEAVRDAHGPLFADEVPEQAASVQKAERRCGDDDQ